MKRQIHPIVFLLALTLAWPAPASFAQSENADQKPSNHLQDNKTDDAVRKKPYAKEAIKHYNRGVELHQNGYLQEASNEYKAAIDLEWRMMEAWSNLGLIYVGQKLYDKAIESFERALSLSENFWGSDSPRLHPMLIRLAALCSAHNRYAESERLYKQALGINEKGIDSGYPETLEAYAALLRKTNRATEASKLEEKARIIRTSRTKANAE